MAYSEAQKGATARYNKKAYDLSLIHISEPTRR